MFVVVAIVIFGIFIGLTYTLFGSEGLSNDLKGIFTNAIEQSSLSFPHEYVEIGDFRIDKTTNSIVGFSEEGKSNAITELVIPSSIEDIAITRIGDKAFYNLGLTNVEFNEGLKSIGDNAFYGNKLTDITLPNSLEYTGEQSFRGNTIHNLNLGTGIDTLGVLSFYGNKLTKVVIPDNVIEIKWSAFRANKLTEIQLGKNVKYIGAHAFSLNVGLKELYIPESVVDIGQTFIASTSMEKLTLSEKLKPLLSEQPEILGKLYSINGTPNINFYNGDVLNFY